jgi:hypothetical protein
MGGATGPPSPKVAQASTIKSEEMHVTAIGMTKQQQQQ